MKKIYKQEVICLIILLLYWMIPMIFHDKQRKQVMRYFYVEWSKVKLLAGVKPKKLTGSEEQMRRDTHPDPPPILEAINLRNRARLFSKVPNQCHVYILMTILAFLPNTKKQQGCFIGISAVLVLHRMARSALKVPMIA